MQESHRLAIEILPVSGKPATSVEPCNGAFDDPAFGQDDEGVQFVALDDLDDPVAALGSGQRGARSLITGICKDALNEGEQGPRAFVEHGSRAIAILEVGGMNGGA